MRNEAAHVSKSQMMLLCDLDILSYLNTNAWFQWPLFQMKLLYEKFQSVRYLILLTYTAKDFNYSSEERESGLFNGGRSNIKSFTPAVHTEEASG